VCAYSEFLVPSALWLEFVLFEKSQQIVKTKLKKYIVNTSRNAYVMFGGYRSVMLAIAMRYPPNIT